MKSCRPLTAARCLAVCLAGAIAIVWVAGTPGRVEACSTPVYRYAMYNWPPAPYFVFYFHSGQPAEEDAEVNEWIKKLSVEGPKVANLLLEPVDLSQDGLDRMPEAVKQQWQAHAADAGESPGPAHLVFSSWGAPLFSGRLDKTTLEAMSESATRTQVAKALEAGDVAVILFLPGSDPAENERAEKVIEEVIAKAAAGEIPVDSATIDPALLYGQVPNASDEDAAAREAAFREACRLSIGTVQLDRSDPNETWFLNSLTALEPDLDDLADQPMAFFLYGRGRAMFPYVGKGITTENLTGEVQFLSGACSCMVKEGNPGRDLLFRWDWDATAEAVAMKYEQFDGGPYAYQEFSPDDAPMAPSDGQPATEGASPETEGAVVGDATGDSDASVATAALAAAPAASERPGPAAPEGRASEKAEIAPGAVPITGLEPPSSFARRQLWTIGVGLGLGAVVVLAAGVILIRRRAAY